MVYADDTTSDLSSALADNWDTTEPDLAAQDPADYTAINYSSIPPLPGGGESVNFLMDDGTTASILVPPRNFKPLKATDGELAEYGFPARPTDATQLAQWNDEMKKYKKTVVPKQLYKSKKNLTAGAFYGTGTDYSWSGIIGLQTNGQYQHVEGNMTVPVTICSSGGTVVDWVGMGGAYSSDDLLQCGTKEEIISNLGVSPVENITAWWEENAPTGKPTTISLGISARDYVKFSVDYHADANTATYYWHDMTNGNQTSCTKPLNSSFQGNTAEWIDERVQSGNQLLDLANFSSVNWDTCNAAYSDGNYLSMQSFNYQFV